MKIRSITYFCNPSWSLDQAVIQQAADFAAEAQPAFKQAGIEVQTVRLATPPFPDLLPDCSPDKVIPFAQTLENELKSSGFDYIAIGPAMPDNLESYLVIPDLVAETDIVFASGVMATRAHGISLPAVRAWPAS